MIRIALTGGIGTGKTYLSKHFIQMGIPVFYADDEAKKLYSDSDFLNLLREKIPDPVLWSQTGELIMTELKKSCINKSFLEKLSSVVHPFVMRKFDEWAKKQLTSSVIMESAIIFEYGLENFFDKIIVADAPEELRIERIKKRNPEMSENQICTRISQQMSQQEKCIRADLVICTGETYKAKIFKDNRP